MRHWGIQGQPHVSCDAAADGYHAAERLTAQAPVIHHPANANHPEVVLLFYAYIVPTKSLAASQSVACLYGKLCIRGRTKTA